MAISKKFLLKQMIYKQLNYLLLMIKKETKT
jgi:hypothetical protein